jgi:hypothetical protein
VAAGCYDELFTGAVPGEGLQYIEYFKPDAGMGDEETAEFFRVRADQEPEGELNLVLRRIGLLGPEPGGMALWTFPDFASMEGIARQGLSGKSLKPVTVGVYRSWGKEVL